MAQFAKWLNKQRVIERLKAVPPVVTQAAERQLDIETTGLVDAQRRAAPVGGSGDPHPGEFRDSIHKYPNTDRPLGWRIIADAKDPKGGFIGPHIEFGHHTPEGGYVPARPSFFPTYRARKKGMRNRLNAAVRKAAKAAAGA